MRQKPNELKYAAFIIEMYENGILTVALLCSDPAATKRISYFSCRRRSSIIIKEQ